MTGPVSCVAILSSSSYTHKGKNSQKTTKKTKPTRELWLNSLQSSAKKGSKVIKDVQRFRRNCHHLTANTEAVLDYSKLDVLTCDIIASIQSCFALWHDLMIKLQNRSDLWAEVSHLQCCLPSWVQKPSSGRGWVWSGTPSASEHWSAETLWIGYADEGQRRCQWCGPPFCWFLLPIWATGQTCETWSRWNSPDTRTDSRTVISKKGSNRIHQGSTEIPENCHHLTVWNDSKCIVQTRRQNDIRVKEIVHPKIPYAFTICDVLHVD